MYKIISFLSLLLWLNGVSCNNEQKTDKANTGKQDVADVIKAHTCNAACKNGNHVYVHTEIGHTCSSDCGKPHVCGADCQKGTHVYAHGEVGHYCMCAPRS